MKEPDVNKAHKKFLAYVASSDIRLHKPDADPHHINSPFLNSSFTPLLKTFPSVVLLYDFSLDRYTFVSDNITDHYGYPAEAFLGQSSMAFVNAISPDQYLIFMQQIFPDVMQYSQQYADQAKDLRFNCSLKINNANNQGVWSLLQVYYLATTPTGLPLISISFVTDVSQIKNDEIISHTISLKDPETELFVPLMQKQFPLNGNSLELSPRELEILLLLSQGKTSKDIAGNLSLSLETVKKHRQNMMHKLNVSNSASLLKTAMVRGLLG